MMRIMSMPALLSNFSLSLLTKGINILKRDFLPFLSESWVLSQFIPYCQTRRRLLGYFQPGSDIQRLRPYASIHHRYITNTEIVDSSPGTPVTPYHISPILHRLGLYYILLGDMPPTLAV